MRNMSGNIFEDTSDALSGDAERQAQAVELVARGNELLLRQTKAADAAGAFAQALQLAPNLVTAHLGMAEANFALGQIPIARTAAEYVIRLAPDTLDAQIAQALILVIDRQFVPAVELLQEISRKDPGKPYIHALRGYVLRSQRNDYDAALAEAKAGRLSGAVDMRALFPRIEPVAPKFPPPVPGTSSATPRLEPVAQQPQWQQRPAQPARRQMTRISFATRGIPIATYTLIGLCLVVYVAQVVTSGNLSTDSSVTLAGVEYGPAIRNGEWWRFITSMFLHADITHIFFNMLSLYFIGPLVERIYGVRRFLLIYFGSGLIAGLTYFVLVPNFPSLGASGAIAGIFGAIGAFFFAHRGQLGQIANGFLQQWLFWLGLNVLLNIYTPGLAWQAHVGGLIAGLVLGLVLAPRGR